MPPIYQAQDTERRAPCAAVSPSSRARSSRSTGRSGSACRQRACPNLIGVTQLRGVNQVLCRASAASRIADGTFMSGRG
jgi:hypothetical protein